MTVRLAYQETMPSQPGWCAYLLVQIESKLFYLDLKENARGQYLKIAEKGSNRERSTVIVPKLGIPWFRELFNYYAAGVDEQGRCVAGGVH